MQEDKKARDATRLLKVVAHAEADSATNATKDLKQSEMGHH